MENRSSFSDDSNIDRKVALITGITGQVNEKYNMSDRHWKLE